MVHIQNNFTVDSFVVKNDGTEKATVEKVAEVTVEETPIVEETVVVEEVSVVEDSVVVEEAPVAE